jgi:hypothetical protein
LDLDTAWEREIGVVLGSGCSKLDRVGCPSLDRFALAANAMGVGSTSILVVTELPGSRSQPGRSFYGNCHSRVRHLIDLDNKPSKFKVSCGIGRFLLSPGCRQVRIIARTSSNVEGRVEGQTQKVSGPEGVLPELETRTHPCDSRFAQYALKSRVSKRVTFNLQPVTRAKRVPQALRTEGPEPRAERAA